VTLKANWQKQMKVSDVLTNFLIQSKANRDAKVVSGYFSMDIR